MALHFVDGSAANLYGRSMEEDLSILYREKSLMDTFYHPDRDHTLHPSQDEQLVALLARGHQDTKPGPGLNKIYENINYKSPCTCQQHISDAFEP